MSKLSDKQLVLLSAAARRGDRIIVPPAGIEDRATAKLFRPLLKQKLVEEVPAVNGHPVFRRDPEAGAIALRITDGGLAAIGIEPTGTDEQQAKTKKKSSREPASKQKPKGKAKAVPPKMRSVTKAGPGERGAPQASSPDEPGAPHPGSKQALLIAMLQKKQGADIDAIVGATGWLPHTARAMISGLRKAGYEIELERRDDAKSVYRIVRGPKRASGRKKT